MNKKRKILISVILMVVLLTIVFSFWQKPVLAHSSGIFQGESKLFSALAKAVGYIVFFVLSAIGKLTVLIIDLLVKVAQFNTFIDAPAVVKGWVIMRDICNMFFIIILLIISFCTVLGIESWNYKRLLGKLILAAILINFSKMFCGLMIDAGQVVMMTFVNAFKDMAGGNIVNAIGLNNILSFSNNLNESDLKSAMSITTAVIMATIFTFVSFATVLSIFLILLVRIVMLWFLVIFSPVVWVGGLVPVIGNMTSPWWDKFTKWIIIGPILAFFLWLSLSIVSPNQTPTGYYYNKSIEGTKAANNQDDPITPLGSLLAITEPARALDYGFAIAMLIMSLGFAVQLGGAAAGKIVGFGKKAGWGLAGLTATVTGGKWAASGIKRQFQAAKEKVSTVPVARMLTAEGRAARTKDLDEKARIRFGVPGAYERSINRKTKEYEEKGLFRNVAEMKDNFEIAKKNRDYAKAEIYGRQLAKKKELEASHLEGLTTGLAGRDYQRAANVVNKLSEEADDYNKSMISPVIFENGKYRERNTPQEVTDDIAKLKRRAKGTKSGDMGKTLAHMNNADQFVEQAHFYLGLGEDQLRSPLLEQATREKVVAQLTKIIENANYSKNLRQEAWDRLNGLSQKPLKGQSVRTPYTYSAPTMPKPGGPVPATGGTPPPPPPPDDGGGQINPGGIGSAEVDNKNIEDFIHALDEARNMVRKPGLDEGVRRYWETKKERLEKQRGRWNLNDY